MAYDYTGPEMGPNPPCFSVEDQLATSDLLACHKAFSIWAKSVDIRQSVAPIDPEADAMAMHSIYAISVFGFLHPAFSKIIYNSIQNIRANNLESKAKRYMPQEFRFS